MDELTPQGGPGLERDLPFGNWRITRRPAGERRVDIRAAHEGLSDIGKAQENWGLSGHECWGVKEMGSMRRVSFEILA